MQHLRYLFAALAIVSAVVAPSAPAAAQPYLLTQVSGTGVDTNNCFDTPCATISKALSVTDIGGKVQCLGPGSFSSFTIVRSVTISCPPDFGSTDSITINVPAGNANDPKRIVVIRGLTVQGATVAATGIDIVAAVTVILDDVLVSDYTGAGIRDHRTGGGTQLFVRNSTVANTAGPGIVVAAGATNTVVLENVRSFNNPYGLAAGSGNNVAISRSIFSGNSVVGITGDAGSQISVDGAVISHNNIGVQSGSSIRLSNSNISFNNAAISGNTGTFGNNRLFGNGIAGTALMPLGGASSDIAQQ